MTNDHSASDRERQLDAITWPRLGKRWSECTISEMETVLADLRSEIDANEVRIARMQARCDQYDAAVADGLEQAAKWANGLVQLENWANRNHR
ncbi:DUF724 domain-containing protein [Nocardia sp. CDC159]|uniref:DUF724 domain-containing protein n=1 Tax=Nocardia pulmonis TaxID=2951408 RepID=A0A9X2J0Z2_9NOCA|nr:MULTISPECIES: DUF724 domain-containing protein [Nocardia]MCM6776441.1 DUF724 domain-containing protein [Nocardia pulmonis]MCM6788865.1 DUF724 domain-containing protein [Nocardia sp. CDC159]